MRLVVDDDVIIGEAAEQLEGILRRVDAAANRFRADSELSVVNRRAGRVVPISRDLTWLVAAAVDAAERTDGVVDPLIGSRLREWGYDRDIGELPPTGPDVRSVARTARCSEIEFDATIGLLRLPAGSALDLGATAKSQAADEAARAIHRRFGSPVLVELGGDVAVAGRRPDGWSIWVAEREGGPGELVALRHGGLATSTTTIRRWRRGDRMLHHIIDPRTGAPAEGCWRTATVAAASALEANIASTASIVLGENATAWLREHGLSARLVHCDGRIATTGDWPTRTPTAMAS